MCIMCDMREAATVDEAAELARPLLDALAMVLEVCQNVSRRNPDGIYTGGEVEVLMQAEQLLKPKDEPKPGMSLAEMLANVLGLPVEVVTMTKDGETKVQSIKPTEDPEPKPDRKDMH